MSRLEKRWLENNNPAAGIYKIDYIISALTSNPYVCIWAFSVLVWFLIEVDLWASHNFNSKHSYGLYAKRVLLSLDTFVKILKTSKNKKSFLKTLYKVYI